jgi:hypothetical protein
LLQVDVAEIVGHEADEPDASVDLLEADLLAGKYAGYVAVFDACSCGREV